MNENEIREFNTQRRSQRLRRTGILVRGDVVGGCAEYR